MEQSQITFYEELQSNAFPAVQIVMYDGWSVRFGGNFTYRVNCANPMYPETLPPAEKLPYVEELYRNSGLNMSIVKLHDGMDPVRCQTCEALLDEMDYSSERSGHIYLCDLKSFTYRPKTQVRIETRMTEAWLEGFLTMNGTAEDQKPVAAQMLRNVAFPIAAASIWEDGKMVACGLGVLERGNVGLYDIYVDGSCRRRGLGGDICAAIMLHGRENGCDTAYLQCLDTNQGARKLYDMLGYSPTYHYWFRTRKF